MKKRILVFALFVVTVCLTVSVALAAVTISGYDPIDMQIGLTIEQPSAGGFYSRGVEFHYAIDDNPSDIMNSTILWSVTPTNGGPALTITSEGTGRESTRAWLNLDPTVSYSIGRNYTYDLSMDINGTVTTRSITVNFVNNQLPTAYGLSVAPVAFTSSSATLGTPVAVTNGEMYNITGETYVVSIEITGTSLDYSSGWRNWSDTEWEELDQWDDTRLSALNLDGGKTGIYTAKKMGTYPDHNYIVSFYGNNNSNIACYIPYTLYVTDANGNLPALVPEIHGNYNWSDWNATSFNYLLYSDVSLGSGNPVWQDPGVINLYLSNSDELAQKYGGSPVWTATDTVISGERLSFDYEGDAYGCHGNLRSIPTTPSESEITVSCTWGGQTSSVIIYVEVSDSSVLPYGLPTGISGISDVIETKVGQTITLEPSILPAGYYASGYSGTYFCANGLWSFADRDWNQSVPTYQVNTAGIFTDTVGIQFGPLMTTKTVTFKVKDANGNLPAPILENGNSEWTWYTGLSGQWPHNGGTGSDTGIIQLRIPEQYWQGGSVSWTITNNRDGSASKYDFDFEVETWNNGRGIRLRPTWASSDETVTGDNTYTITASYNGQTFESTEAIHFVSASYPTGMTMKVNEVDLSTNTLGAAVPLTDGGFTLMEGKDYIFTSNYVGNVPSSNMPNYMNGGLDGALSEYGRYDNRFWNGNGYIWSDNQQIFAAVTPGQYDFQASLSIGMSNLVSIQHYTIWITDVNGNIPVPTLVLENNRQQINRYLGFTHEMEEDTGVFSWNALADARIDEDLYQQMEAIYGEGPSWDVQQTAGATLPVSWAEEQDGRVCDVRLESWDLANYQPGTAEITITCTWGDQTATSATQVNILDLPNGAPSGIDYNNGSDVVECQIGDTLVITPSILPTTWGGIPGYTPAYAGNSGEFEQFCDILDEGDWGRKVEVTTAGIYQCFVGVGIDTVTAGRWITYKVKDENGVVPTPALEINGYFSFTEGIDLNETATFYVASDLPLDSSDDEVLYSRSNLFTYGIDNWWQIKDYMTGEPDIKVRQISGNVKYTSELWNDKSHIDIRLTEMPKTGSAEFEATCTIDGQTYTQNVKVNFVSLPSRPTGVEIGYSNPMIAKFADRVDYNPDIRFKNNWQLNGQLTYSLYGDGDFWNAVVWDNSTWNQSGIFTMQMVACSGNICMNKTIKVVVAKADGTMENSKYIPFGTVATVPSSLKVIESEAFSGTQLTEIDIPTGVNIAADAFDGTDLVAIYAHDQATVDYAVNNGYIAVVDQ